MKLSELNPTVRALTSEFYELEFDCPTCRKYRIPITFRIGTPKHDAPRAWGATSADVTTISLDPSVHNSHHGRTRCLMHVVIERGTVTVR